MLGGGQWLARVAVCAALSGCAPAPQIDVQGAITEVSGRTVQFPDYPQAGRTYLTFSGAHGFQVNYMGTDGATQLWYPGNFGGLTGAYKRDKIGGRDVLCWRYGAKTYNPVTKTQGGDFACEPLDFARKTVVAQLRGDPFGLASGKVPYRLPRCTAPPEFSFDRARFSC